MDKGIRQGVNAKFNEMLPQLPALGGKAFRAAITSWTMEQYGTTIASAATHYNHAFQAAKKAVPEQVAGLGRPPEKNNGGRKKKAAVEVATETAVVEFVDAESVVPATVTVKKQKDGTVVAENVTIEQAKELVAKAIAGKKAKLFWI